MDFAVMHAAERDRELIAGLAAERARLCVAQMVGIGWLSPADQAGLPGDMAQMILVTVAMGLANGECDLFIGKLLHG